MPRRRRDLPEPGAPWEAGTARRHRPRAGRAGPGRAGRGVLAALWSRQIGPGRRPRRSRRGAEENGRFLEEAHGGAPG